MTLKSRLLAERPLTSERDRKGRPVRSVTVNLAESPLGWLHSRGHVSRRQFDAGERLRLDWERSQLPPRVTMSWDAAPIARSRGRGAKRSSEELDKLAERFQTFVKENPGLRIEQINKQLGTTTKDLALPIRKLISEGAIKTKGEKRSTTYFASEKKKKN
jgi:hypothetical protein